MVETVLCFHPHCTTKRRGVKPEEELCSKPVSPAEIGTYGKKIKAISCELLTVSCELLTISCELLTVSCELLTVSCELKAEAYDFH